MSPFFANTENFIPSSPSSENVSVNCEPSPFNRAQRYPGSRIPAVHSLFEWSCRCQVFRPHWLSQMAAAHRHTAYRATSGLPTSELCAAFLLLSDGCLLTENCEQIATTQQLAEFPYQQDYNAGTTLGVGMSFWCFI
jgi:hypothetical protein